MEHEYRMHEITYKDKNNSMTASPTDLKLPIILHVCVRIFVKIMQLFSQSQEENEEVTKYIYDRIKCVHMLA